MKALAKLESLILKYYEVDSFFDKPYCRKRIEARRLFRLIARENLHASNREIADHHNEKIPTIAADITSIRAILDVDVPTEHKYKLLATTWEESQEPFDTNVHFQNGVEHGIQKAINALKNLL